MTCDNREDSVSIQCDQSVARSNEAAAARKVQILVKLDNCKTHCLNFVVPPASSDKCATTSSTCTTTKCHGDHGITPIPSTSPSSPFDFLPISNTQILDKLSLVTGIPQFMLKLYNKHEHKQKHGQHQQRKQYETSKAALFFLSAYTFLPIRGGKGGFGTLLKGQSKQAGAKRTMDFGACRDLNGRRLRHINDEIKLRKWRESMQKKIERANNNNDGGVDGNGIIDIEEEIEQLKTASGIRNWHLMVPNWSEAGGGAMSSKSRNSIERKLRREVEMLARQSKQEHDEKMKKKEAWQQSIVSYAKAGEEYAKEQDKKMTNSILEGLSKRKKRKLADGSSSKLDNSEEAQSTNKAAVATDDQDEYGSSFLALSSICTLSGDVVIEDGKGDDSEVSMMVQSKSEFATSAILLNSSLLNCKSSNACTGLYYEVTVKTCGIAQLGWALIPKLNDGLKHRATEGFNPNSDTGDGVGDDAFSYGFDGSRGLVFHDGKEKKFGKSASGGTDYTSWKDGDVVGCMYDFGNGTIQYSINGNNLGVAFNIESRDDSSLSERLLYPVFSLNESEIIGLNIGPTFQYCPEHYSAISTLLEKNKDDSAKDEKDTAEGKLLASQQDDKAEEQSLLRTGKIATKKKGNGKRSTEISDKAKEEEEPLNLNEYNSAKELVALGGDRLKNELYSLGCKCGGSLEERAERLFATKGLERDQFPKKIRGKNFIV